VKRSTDTRNRRKAVFALGRRKAALGIWALYSRGPADVFSANQVPLFSRIKSISFRESGLRVFRQFGLRIARIRPAFLLFSVVR